MTQEKLRLSESHREISAMSCDMAEAIIGKNGLVALSYKLFISYMRCKRNEYRYEAKRLDTLSSIGANWVIDSSSEHRLEASCLKMSRMSEPEWMAYLLGLGNEAERMSKIDNGISIGIVIENGEALPLMEGMLLQAITPVVIV